MNLPHLPHLPIPVIQPSELVESASGVLGALYLKDQMKDYGKLCHNTAIDEAIELVNFLRYNSVDYIIDCLMDLKG